MRVSVQLDEDDALLARHILVTVAVQAGVPIGADILSSAGAFAESLRIFLRLGLHEVAAHQLAKRGRIVPPDVTSEELLAEFRALRAADKQVPALCKCARCEQRRAAGEVTP